MRKKLLSKTYLRDVKKYELKFICEDDCYVVVKKIIDAGVPFKTSSGLTLIDNNYCIVEVVPKSENYAMRVYFDDHANILQYYFDISRENGIDPETKIPYYDDLFVDITVTNGEIKILDMSELENAFKENQISEGDYNLAQTVTENLFNEIKNKNNKYMNKKLDCYL